MSHQNAVDVLLIRLGLVDAIPAFKEMGIDKFVQLRKITDDELRSAVPDDDKRHALMEAIQSRGNLQKRHSGPSAGGPNLPRNNETNIMRGGFEEGSRGGGFRPRGRGRGTRSGPRGGGPVGGEDHTRACVHFFSNDGCRYGSTCRYSHDESMRQRAMEMTESNTQRNEQLAAQHDFSVECVIPSERIKYLLGVSGSKLKSINDKCETYNERFEHVDEAKETFTLKLYGNSKDSVLRARDMVLNAVGVRKEEEQKSRFQYAVNELDANVKAAKLLVACNIKNKGTNRFLSENALKLIISSLRFPQPQQVRHFFFKTSNNDKEKLETISKILTQLKGVQAILFAEAKRVEDMSKGSYRISRYFNGLEPHFVYRSLSKEDRMEALEKFKAGVENENGVKQRLLVTTEDYAKLARKTAIPYVNLVINFSVPRTEEFYALQSQVVGRHGTTGASFLCVSEYDETPFRELEKNIHFDNFTDEESFHSTALEMSYDTHAQPLTPEDAEPQANWREHLNDKRPKNTFGKRH